MNSVAHTSARSQKSYTNNSKTANVFPSNIAIGLEGREYNDLREEFTRIRIKLLELQRYCHAKTVHYSKIRGDVKYLGVFRSDSDSDIVKLKKRSIALLFETARQSGFREVDFHGLYLDEAQELLIILIDQIIEMMCDRKNTKWSLEVITGKGQHSQGSPVLHPKLKSFLEQEGYEVKSVKSNAVLSITIRV